MKRFLPTHKRLFALLLVLGFGMGTAYAYDFYKNCSTGQRLYYNIIDATNHYVEITHPANSTDNPWGGYNQPEGNITLPSTVTYGGVTYTVKRIGDYAFYQCENLTGSLTIPSSVTLIGEEAFEGCSGFTGSLTIPSSVTYIDYGAFKGCSGFTGSLNIPNSVTFLNSVAFSGCSGFNGTLTIPASIYEIGFDTFKGCSGLTGTLTLPNSLNMIAQHAFAGCSGFTGSLIIPNSVTEIGESAFEECTGFNGSLTIGSSVTTIGNYAFFSCVNFTGSLTIPNSVTTIGFLAFWGCYHFDESLTLGNSLTTIGNGAFAECTHLTGTLTIPSSVTSIGDMAFEGCERLTGSLTIPNSVTTMGSSVFGACYGFNGSLTISNSLTTLGDYVFADCSGFTGSLTIPNSVTTIGRNAFINCSGFTGTLTIGTGVTSIGMNAFKNCSGFTGNLSIPNSVTTIDEEAFMNCVGFTGSLTIGNSVTTIGASAFAYCSGFTGSLTIPNSVTFIGSYAFHHCSGFTFMTVFPETPPTLGASVFQYVSTAIPVFVPCGSLADYQAASGWSAFTNMQCMETQTVYDGTATSQNVPAYIFYFDDFTRSQFVIPAADLAEMAGSTINSMTFYTTSTSVPYTTVSSADVYLKEVDYTSISAYEPKNSATIVYSGYFNIVSTGNGGEMTIHFSTPYTYNGGNLLVGIENTQDNGWKRISFYGQTVSGASISGYNDSSTGTIPANQQNFIPKTTFSYCPSECSMPKDLTATDLTINSATLDWTGYQDSYDLRYRKKPIFFEDFEHGLPSGWTTIDNDGDGYNWHSASNYGSSYCHSGSNTMVSASYDNDNSIALTPDNWLITPLLDLRGIMKVWISALHPNYAQEHFAIYLSTTGNSVSDFTIPLVPETTLTSASYRAYAADLSAYAGWQGYIAIRHFNCTDMYEILLDDFGIFEGSNETGGWETLSNIGSNYTLSSLVPDTEYEWQVRGCDCDGEGTYTGWSRAHSFVTLPLCLPEDQCELTFQLTDSYGDGWNGAAINVVDVETGIVIGTMTNNNLNGTTGSGTNELNTLYLIVCDGRELRFEWVSGSWDSECSYTVTDANGNEVFSGSGAMGESVTYMVSCNAVVQTIALSAGINWFSTNVEVTLDDLKAALLEASPNTSITIKGKSGSIKYIVRTHSWNGTLDWDITKMYKIEVPNACELMLEGTPINPVEHPITISPNTANWIGYPLIGSMTVTAAFANFEAVTGDVIQSKGGSTRYRNGSWRPNGLTTLEPGQGYIYNSAATSERTLVFPLGAR